MDIILENLPRLLEGAWLTIQITVLAVVIGLVVLVLFSLLHLIPGDPATIALGPRATPEAIARYAEKMHLDEPVWRQFRLLDQRPVGVEEIEILHVPDEDGIDGRPLFAVDYSHLVAALD